MESDALGPNSPTASMAPSQPGAVCELPSTKDIRVQRKKPAPKLQPTPIETTAPFSGLGSKSRIARAVAPNVSVFVPDNAAPEMIPQLVPDANPSDEGLGVLGMVSTRNTDEFWGVATQEHISGKQVFIHLHYFSFY